MWVDLIASAATAALSYGAYRLTDSVLAAMAVIVVCAVAFVVVRMRRDGAGPAHDEHGDQAR